MDGKVVVITGASAGLGKASAFDLAARGRKSHLFLVYIYDHCLNYTRDCIELVIQVIY